MAAKTLTSQTAVGMFWVVLSLGFEAAPGRFVMRATWERIISDFDLHHGGLMPIGITVMLFAPAIAANVLPLPNDQ